MKKITVILILINFINLGCKRSNKINVQEEKIICGKDSFSIFGKWKVVDFKSGIVSVAPDRAKDFIGRYITIKKDTAILLNMVCYDKIQYKIRTVNAEEYINFSYNISPIKLGIDENEICILEIYCAKGEIDIEYKESFDDIIIYKDQLIDSWDGHFFYLERQ
ncbi:MAG: hypothetical protein OEW75_05290 [Cyclobacteriaceae bacterium]|nr:hypothetical protein [Cyclobacteriaceae bacterium]